MKRPEIPEQIKRELRKEAFFGCVICGCPIIRYHHIVPYSKVKNHNKENLVLLCPNDHARADCNEISIEKVTKAKIHPFNKNIIHVGTGFFLKNYKNLKFKIGGCYYIRPHIILRIDGNPLLSIRADVDGSALLSALFYNKDNTLIAEIIDNEWNANLNSEIWDIQYSPGHLKIHSGKGNILCELNSKNENIEMQAKMYYKGKLFLLSPTKTIIGGFTMSGGVIRDSRCVVDLQSSSSILNL